MARERILSGNLQWGVSCLCADETQMGVLLGAMTVLGCKNIAWQPVRTNQKLKETLAAKKAAGEKVGRPTGRKTAQKQRKPAEAVGAAFLSHHAGKFRARDLSRALVKEGYSDTRAFSLINAWKKAGSVKKTATGEYENRSKKAA